MNQSENIMDLVKALSLAQSEMQPAIKDSINPFYKNKYADLGNVWDVCRPVLTKNGLCVMQTTEMVNDKTVLVTILAHTSGQWIKSFLPLNPAKNDSQGMGAAITYLRRYSLSALVGVVCDDEDDGETAVGRGKAKVDSNSSQKKDDSKSSQVESQNVLKSTKLVDNITKEQLAEIIDLSEKIDDTCRENMLKYLWDKHSITENSLSVMSQEAFNTCKQCMLNNIEMNKKKAM